MPQIRVIRVLVYEGEEEWVEATIAKSQVQGKAGKTMANGSRIYEKERYQDLLFVPPGDWLSSTKQET